MRKIFFGRLQTWTPFFKDFQSYKKKIYDFLPFSNGFVTFSSVLSSLHHAKCTPQDFQAFLSRKKIFTNALILMTIKRFSFLSLISGTISWVFFLSPYFTQSFRVCPIFQGIFHIQGFFPPSQGFSPIFQGFTLSQGSSHSSKILPPFQGFFPFFRDDCPFSRTYPLSKGSFPSPIFEELSPFSGVLPLFQRFFHLSGIFSSYPGDAHPPSHSWDARLPSI